jgi:molybdopterin synthase catalytic subunit
MTVRVLFFAYLRERCRVRETTVELQPGASVDALWQALQARYPTLPDVPPRFALTGVYVDRSAILHDNDELALIPPVSGGCDTVEPGTMFRITDQTIDTTALLASVGDPGAGAAVLFVGTTRDENEGRVVERLEYEVYGRMAESEMARIGAEIAARWPVRAVAMVHRVGVVPVGEASVGVAVSAPHRDDAFAACRFGIDRLKATVPIWKKEHHRGGTVWIGACHEHGTPATHEGRE